MGQRRGIRMDRGEDAELQLDYADLCRINPHLVVLHVPPLGNRGPLANFDASDELVSALGGIYGSQWALSGNPVALHFPAASYSAGVLGATATVAAALRPRLGQQRTIAGTVGRGLSIGRRVFASDRRHHAPRKDDPHV